MAGDYWRSSQANDWILTPDELQLSRLEDIRYAGTDEKIASVHIWMSNAIAQLSKRLGLRQRVTATSTIFFHRFYSIAPNGYCNTDPCLVATSCIYLASKVEETPLHIKSILNESIKFWKEVGHSTFIMTTSELAEMEFYLVRDLNYNLVLFHPYRSLMKIVGSVGSNVTEKSEAGIRLQAKVAAALAATTKSKPTGLGIDAEALGVGSSQLQGPNQDIVDNTNASIGAVHQRFQLEEELARAAMTMGDHGNPIARAAEIDEGVVQMAWFLLNDTYRHPSLHLLHPPYVLALSSIYLALVLRETTREKVLASTRRMEERRRYKMAQDEQRIKEHRQQQQSSTTDSDATTAGNNANSSTSSVVGPTPQPDILTFLASLNIAPTYQLGACIQGMLNGYSIWNRVQGDIEGSSGNSRVMKWLEEWRRSREEEIRVIELQQSSD
ncbi:unnamed protein product [Sympodiomycopsis kandeliae]